MSMDDLLRSMRVWRGRGAELAQSAIPTGFAELDRYLPGGGWPRGALTEICLEHYGIGEISLLLAALARLASAASTPRQWIVWVAPPYIPYAPALEQRGVALDRQLLVHPRSGGKSALWATEQAARSGLCAAVLAWVRSADEVDLRRLQLSAEVHASWIVLFRPRAALEHRSPAALRLELSHEVDAPCVSIVKCRGRQPARIKLAGCV